MKQLLAFMLLAIVSATTFSQDSTAQSVTSEGSKLVINPQVGISLSQLSTDPEEAENQYHLGYHFGGYLRLGNTIYLQPGIFWHRMGFELQTTEEIEDEQDFENDINSIQVPVLLGINVINSELFTLRANGGGVASFITSVKENPLISEDDFKSTIFSARVGAGVDLFGLTADAGYDFGLTEIFKDTEVFDIEIDNDTKINSWFFSVGLKL
jgi:hypothetical protein